MGAIDDAALVSEIEHVIEGAGMRVLELVISTHRGNVKTKAVIYVPAGTGTAECAAASRLILPRLQIALGVQDPEIEVSSPGIDRTFHSSRDWETFTGKRLRYLVKGENEWRFGTLQRYANRIASISGLQGPIDIDISTIAKARLDSSHEGE
jgi:ribosome maturation factor RimP